MKKLLLIILILFGLKAQAQSSYCDSIEIWFTYNTGADFIELETNFKPTNFPNISYVQQYNWECISALSAPGWCLISTDTFADLYADTNLIYGFSLEIIWCDTNLCYSCTVEDTLVWDSSMWNFSSQMINTPVIPVFVKDIKNKVYNNKMYDLYGREIFEIPLNKIYIKNNKKYIKL